MSTKKPTPDSDRKADPAGEAQEPEPIIVKDRGFWGKKAKVPPAADANGAAPGADAQELPQSDEGAQEAEALAQHAKHLSTIAELQGRLADKEARLNATVVQYKEALEEFDGAKARLKRDVQKDVAKGKRDILTGLLDVIDNLERALAAAATGANAAGNPDFKGFFDGVSMVRDQFGAKLTALGVTRVSSLGEAFDPLHFEAISTVPVPDAAQHDTVVGVVRDAYLLNGETLRHGIVAVGKHAG